MESISRLHWRVSHLKLMSLKNSSAWTKRGVVYGFCAFCKAPLKIIFDGLKSALVCSPYTAPALNRARVAVFRVNTALKTDSESEPMK